MGVHGTVVGDPEAMARGLVHLFQSPKSPPDFVDSTPAPIEYKQETTPVPLEATKEHPSSWVSERVTQTSEEAESPNDTAHTPQRGGRRKRTHSPDVWEAHKAEISRLYLDENKRLKDVMEIMESQWGFRASQKMYKTKLTQWKFFKNNRQADVANLLYLQRHRLAIGKESTFHRNGKPIDVEAYMRRRGISAFDLVEVADSSDLPPTIVRCRTPPSVPRPLDPPDDLRLKERFFEWTSQKFIKPRPIETGYLKKLDSHHASKALYSVQLLTHGCWLFSTGRNQEAGNFCRGAFALLHHVLDASAFLSIFEILMVIRRYPNAEIIKELWNYLSRYAAAIEGVNKPLYRILICFSHFARQHELEHNIDILDWALRWASSRFASSFDGKPFDYTMLKPWDIIPVKDSYHRYYLCLNHWEADSIPTATIPSLDQYEDPSNLRADLLLIFGNRSNWSDDRLSKIALRVLEQNRLSSKPSDYLEFVCLYCTARHNRQRSTRDEITTSVDHKLAREYLQLAADVQRRAWPLGKNYYETLSLLESWQREDGDYESAEATRKKRDQDCINAFTTLCI
ncbi:uncharacterized protein F4822DRAFT_417403 [Hypoxylon trugodes]|uniref:uncharacterized protein n=1 Tax=Hypoxylon trugodes TaxID=326681 RepID=UPI00218D66AA|nr:uncharacterized protein F4822DRAFT_417403 [Hypoxylon trugodes]KAI1383734.1 hypothetical protein F4822DRAFT_417403 [Hypoxylon trugodes]